MPDLTERDKARFETLKAIKPDAVKKAVPKVELGSDRTVSFDEAGVRKGHTAIEKTIKGDATVGFTIQKDGPLSNGQKPGAQVTINVTNGDGTKENATLALGRRGEKTFKTGNAAIDNAKYYAMLQHTDDKGVSHTRIHPVTVTERPGDVRGPEYKIDFDKSETYKGALEPGNKVTGTVPKLDEYRDLLKPQDIANKALKDDKFVRAPGGPTVS